MLNPRAYRYRKHWIKGRFLDLRLELLKKPLVQQAVAVILAATCLIFVIYIVGAASLPSNTIIEIKKPKKAPDDIIISEMNEKKIFSQNGEDGIIDSIFSQIGWTDTFFVEFGTENGSETNTRNLRENYGWNGLLMDGSHQNDSINLHKEFIYHSNIVELLKKYNVPKRFDLLSTDTDFKDFGISEQILAAGYLPRVITSEVNSCFDLNLAITVSKDIEQEMTAWTYFFGASPMAFSILYKKYNYSMVYCEKKGVNCFWIHNDNLSQEDQKKFGRKESIVELHQCANHWPNDAGCWYKPETDKDHKNWREIEPENNEWSSKDYSVTPISIGFEELDGQRCRKFKESHREQKQQIYII